MEIYKDIEKKAYAVRFSARDAGEEIGRARLYIIYNDLHVEPYGLFEDLFVREDYRGKGMGNRLTQMIIEEAKQRGCYKLIGTSKEHKTHVHDMYKKMGFKQMGYEFRMDFT